MGISSDRDCNRKCNNFTSTSILKITEDKKKLALGGKTGRSSGKLFLNPIFREEGQFLQQQKTGLPRNQSKTDLYCNCNSPTPASMPINNSKNVYLGTGYNRLDINKSAGIHKVPSHGGAQYC